MGNHFNILTWRIRIPLFTKKEIENDIYAKSVFIHEYIHYCQTLSSTIGRVLLVELLRVSLRTGIMLNFGESLPKIEKQINLWDTLKNTDKGKLIGTKEYKDYQTVLNELFFATTNKTSLFSGAFNPSFPFVLQDISANNNTEKDFPHIVVSIDKIQYIVPLSDRVIFENMARQVQRKYIVFNNTNGELAKLDSFKVDPNYKIGELTSYTSIHDLLARLITNGEDIGKWTITLCQFSLMCQYPGKALYTMIQLLNDENNRNIYLKDFINIIRKNEYFINVYNKPRLQEVIDELINKFGTVMKMEENYELRELVLLIVKAVNMVNNNWSYFSEDVWVNDHLQVWLNSFGCPPVECKDGTENNIFGFKTNEYWHKYLIRIYELMN